MDGIVERETAEREGGGCGCSGGATLDVLKEVQRAYEQRMELLNSSTGTNKLQKQVQLLQSWVSDLVGQNALLARTVEELEAEVVTRLLVERRRHAERDKSNAYDILNETKKLNEALQNEISTKEREIRRLKKETQQHEQTIMSLRKEVSLDREVSKANAEVTADICCPGMQIGDVTPVKDFSSQLRKETAKYHERLTEMEDSVKSSAEKVRALREANVALSTEVASLQQVACALAEQCRAHVVRAAFLEDVVREMRRQLRHAKTKIITSTPNSSREIRQVKYESDISIIEPTPSPPIVISNESIDLRTTGSSTCRTQKSCHQIDQEEFERTTADVELECKPSCQNQACSAAQNESMGASSIAESIDSDARSRCLETKLMATLEVLKNKEETVRVQAESLALAEARIAELSARAPRTPRTPASPRPCSRPHRTDHDPLHITRSSADGCCIESSDATEQTPEVDSKMVNTLRENLSVIEELYRECFYETAKQEELIEILRQSYLDMRQMDKQKTARITRLQGVVDTQHWSLEKCKDIALEVDNLKSEISNFLSSSNHDSGMWEREEPAAELADELRHISTQLLQLRDLLTDNCTCGLEEENMRLKRINETLQIQLGEFQQKVADLEAALEDKENIDRNHKEQIDLKDLEIDGLKQQLVVFEKESREQKNTCNTLNLQIQQLQVLLKDRSEELTKCQQQCEEHVATVAQLRTELSKTENLSKEKSEVRSEVSALCETVCAWRGQLQDSRRRLRALDEQLRAAREHIAHLHHVVQEKEATCSQLRSQLEESWSRGAALCVQSRHALDALRHWLRTQRELHREQEQRIKEQDKIIRNLQRHRLQSDVELTSSEPCCSKYVPQARQSQQSHAGASETATSCSKCPTNRERTREGHTSQSEMSSNQSAPTPPRRLRKKPLCKERHCQWPSYCEVSSQRPLRSDVETGVSRDSLPTCQSTHTREISPTDEILERVEQTHDAFIEAHRRWRRKTSFGHLHRGT